MLRSGAKRRVSKHRFSDGRDNVSIARSLALARPAVHRPDSAEGRAAAIGGESA
jgi:hypothetical protein